LVSAELIISPPNMPVIAAAAWSRHRTTATSGALSVGVKGGGTLGVPQRLERRLEGLVEGAFARAFRSELQPVHMARAVQREMDDRAAIVARGRTLVPNDFVVELAETDHARLDVYAETLGVELANLARDYAREQGYSFVGPVVRIRFEGAPDMTTGAFRIRSGVIRGSIIEGGETRLPTSDVRRTQGHGFAGHPRRVAPMAKRLVTAAAWLLPAWERARYVEEFRSELWEIAHAGGRRRTQLAYAARQAMSAWRLRADLKGPRRRGAAP
jgi:Protein of unknown function (DUF3662)